MKLPCGCRLECPGEPISSLHCPVHNQYFRDTLPWTKIQCSESAYRAAERDLYVLSGAQSITTDLIRKAVKP